MTNQTYKTFFIMLIVIFIWVFSLPILFITSIIWLPVGSALIITSSAISLLAQIHYNDKIIIDGTMRKIMNSIPFSEWFESYTEHQDTYNNGLILAHPHGILCCGMVIHHFKSKNTVMAVAPILFYVPIFGWAARSCGLIPATNEMIRKALNNKYKVILYIGGVEELIAHPNNQLYIEKRWGYLKIIRDLKIPVTIAWVKGENNTFYLPSIPFLKLRQLMVKYLGVGIMFPWIFGWKNIWIPKPVALDVHFKKLKFAQNLNSLKELKHSYHLNLFQLIQIVYGEESQESKHFRQFLLA